MDHTNIYKRTEEYVRDLFAQLQNPLLVYHNLVHTESVVRKANEIAGHYQLSEKDMMVVFIAAWFHDTGYLYGPAKAHEDKSVEVMKTFMDLNNMPEELTAEIEGCILATKMGVAPVSLVQEIVCDADTYNFGSDEFKKTNKMVFEEWENLNPGLTKKEFTEGALKMFEQHKFYTTYSNDLLNEGKRKNMKKLHSKLEEKAEEKEEKPEKKKKKKKHHNDEDEDDNEIITEKDGTTKGMQTMLRLTSSNHIKLSDMADSKANILISVNAIIISVILSVLLRKLTTDPYLTIPTIIFLAATVITIVIAILATRPKVNLGTFNPEDVKNKKTNLLFFGNFHKMPQKDYEDAMRVMMRDADYLYSSMVQDIYHLGTVLGRKYKLIRLAYTIFMVGIVISVIAFALASVYNVPAPAATPTNLSGSPF